MVERITLPKISLQCILKSRNILDIFTTYTSFHVLALCTLILFYLIGGWGRGAKMPYPSVFLKYLQNYSLN